MARERRKKVSILFRAGGIWRIKEKNERIEGISLEGEKEDLEDLGTIGLRSSEI